MRLKKPPAAAPLPARDSAERADLSLGKAGVLDIPLIFNLMLEGGVAGAFTDRYLFAAGHFKLLLWIARATFTWPTWARINTAPRLLVLRQGTQEVGFAQLQHGTASSGEAVITLNLLAIQRAHQNRGFGAWALGTIIREMPENTILNVCCTKYAQAMQHLLHKLRFKRDKVMDRNLVKFSLRKETTEPEAEPKG